MDEWLDRWNSRYKEADYAFGTEPNDYLKEVLDTLKPGKILFPAEGEGRNAVYAAKAGWDVSAFDISIEGKKKAESLAKSNDVMIDYRVGELEKLNYQNEEFDAVALIYAHFPAEIKSFYHKMLDKFLRKGGFVIFEAFSKNHLHYVLKNPAVGGPRDLPSLFSVEELKADFSHYKHVELKEQEIELNEGLYHRGKGSVIRYTGQKQ